jgi:PIN domain-containing protein
LKTNFVLVDFENIQPKNISELNGGPYKIMVFLGSNQAKIPVETALALHGFGSNAEYIRIEGGGRNALDFHIAYYIGRLSVETPDACFHVISKDSGFDPLLKHLNAQGIVCRRLKSISDILLVDKSSSEIPHEKLDAVIDNLAKRKSARPRTIKTLRSSINALFVNQLTDEELDDLIAQLTERGTIKIADGKVHYELPA